MTHKYFIYITLLAISFAFAPSLSFASDRNAKACEQLAQDEGDFTKKGKKLYRCAKMAESTDVCRQIAVTILHYSYQGAALEKCSQKASSAYECADSLIDQEQLKNETSASCAAKATSLGECLDVVDTITYIELRAQTEKYCQAKFK